MKSSGKLAAVPALLLLFSCAAGCSDNGSGRILDDYDDIETCDLGRRIWEEDTAPKVIFRYKIVFE